MLVLKRTGGWLSLNQLDSSTLRLFEEEKNGNKMTVPLKKVIVLLLREFPSSCTLFLLAHGMLFMVGLLCYNYLFFQYGVIGMLRHTLNGTPVSVDL